MLAATPVARGCVPEEWLLIEWPAGDPEPLKYYLSTLPADTPLNDLVTKAHMRWRIERDYQDLKQELGLDHYRRAWLAWLSSSCDALHCCLRLPSQRADRRRWIPQH